MSCKPTYKGERYNSLEEIKEIIKKEYPHKDGIKIDELPITTTLNDLAEIMAYGNNKIILPGYKVEYSTPLGNKYDTLEEVNNEIRGLADADVEVDLSGVKINNALNLSEQEYDQGMFRYKTNDGWYFKNLGEDENGLNTDEKTAKYSFRDNLNNNKNISKEEYEDNKKNSIGIPKDNKFYDKRTITDFIEKNKEYEQSKEIIEQWKKENNIQYDPEEVYSRGQGFYSSIGAYSNLELDLLLKNLIQHIQDNKKASENNNFEPNENYYNNVLPIILKGNENQVLKLLHSKGKYLNINKIEFVNIDKRGYIDRGYFDIAKTIDATNSTVVRYKLIDINGKTSGLGLRLLKDGTIIENNTNFGKVNIKPNIQINEIKNTESHIEIKITINDISVGEASLIKNENNDLADYIQDWSIKSEYQKSNIGYSVREAIQNKYPTLTLSYAATSQSKHFFEKIKNKKINYGFTISAFTKPIDKRLKHIEGTGDRVRFVIYPKSEHIKWAAPTDVHSGSVWDAHKKVSKDKKSELLGVSFTKAPALSNINEVSPNLADIIDNLSHVHNELGIELTTNNFRIEYDDNIDYSTKKLIDNVNKILDDKYGKLVKPEIKKQGEGNWEVESKKFKEKEDAIKYVEDIIRENPDNPFNPSVFDITWKFSVGKQPKLTKVNTTSIESVKSKVLKKDIISHEVINKDRIRWLEENSIDGKYEEDSKNKWEKIEGRWYKVGEFGQNETLPSYTSQAETNLKVAALKEVARKYPRSLITSKVVPINPNLVDNSEIQYSKISSQESKSKIEKLFNNQTNEVSNVKPDVILPIGTSGSGKSTFIKSLPQENLVIIEPDAMRVEFTREEQINQKLQELINNKEIEKDCTGKLKAEKGLATSFVKGGKWKVIKDLKGYPTHKEGGVDLTIGKGGVSIKIGNTQFTAKYGLVIPKAQEGLVIPKSKYKPTKSSDPNATYLSIPNKESFYNNEEDLDIFWDKYKKRQDLNGYLSDYGKDSKGEYISLYKKDGNILTNLFSTPNEYYDRVYKSDLDALKNKRFNTSFDIAYKKKDYTTLKNMTIPNNTIKELKQPSYEEQRQWYMNYIKSPLYKETLLNEYRQSGKDVKEVDSEILNRYNRVKNVPIEEVQIHPKGYGYIRGITYFSENNPNEINNQTGKTDNIYNQRNPEGWGKYQIGHIHLDPSAKFLDTYIAGHELIHKSTEGNKYLTNSARNKLLSSVNKDNFGDGYTDKELNKSYSYYDNPTEVHARLSELKYMMNQYGIYNPTKEKMTKEHLIKAMKNPYIRKSIDFNIILDMLQNKGDIIDLMNTIAQNKTDGQEQNVV